MNSDTDAAGRQHAALALLATAAAVLLLAGLRISSALSLHAPTTLLTSGLEEEALFGIWRVAGGASPYGDIRDIPYAHSYFNWLFYVAYAAMARAGLWLVDGVDGWIPTIAHLTTLGFAAAGSVALALSLRDGTKGGAIERVAVPASAGALAFFGPLAGLWAFTARPDIAALCLEVMAIGACLRHFRHGGERLLWAAVALSLLAWAFKQTSVVVPAAIVATLALAGQWRKVLAIGAAIAAWVSIPFLAYGEPYVVNAWVASASSPLLFRHGAENLVMAMLKAPAIAVAVPGLLVLLVRDRAMLSSAPARFALAAILGSLALSAVAGSKVGASQNYYFLPGALAIWWLVTLRFGATARDASTQRLLSRLFVVAMLAQSASVVAVLSGAAGRIDISRDGRPIARLAAALPAHEAPVLVTMRSGNLPWIQRRPPHLVFGYLYGTPEMRALGYRHGGIEGLVASGYVRTVVVPRTSAPDLRIAMPAGMRQVAEDEYFRYWSW